LSAAIDARVTQGLHFEGENKVVFTDPWFRYFNDYYHLPEPHLFHFSDVLQRAVSQSEVMEGIKLTQTAAGRAEASKILEGSGPIVALQPLSSDTRKDLPLQSTVAAVSSYCGLHNKEVLLLGAPSERDQLEIWSKAFTEQSVAVRMGTSTLEGALSLIDQSEMLITTDTAVKHLACATATPILEIALGSADWRKTGLYCEGRLIAAPTTSCYPCPHSEACSRSRRDCALEWDSKVLAQVIQHFSEGQWQKLESIANQENQRLQLLRTHQSVAGYWVAQSLAATQEELVLQYVEKSSWKMRLDHGQEISGKTGDESQKIRTEFLGHPFQRGKDLDWDTKALQEMVYQEEQGAGHLASRLRQLGARYRGLKRLGESLALEKFAEYQHLRLSEEEDPNLGFVGLRRAQNQIQSLKERTEIRTQLLRSINCQNMEKT
jgi:hypothetical protein